MPKPPAICAPPAGGPAWACRAGHNASAVLLICENVQTQLTPDVLRALLQEIGEQAPPGSRLLLDTADWPSIGRVHRHLDPDEQATARQWRPALWPALLSGTHPRLRVDGRYSVMAGYGWPYELLGLLRHATRGVPPYAITELGVDV